MSKIKNIKAIEILDSRGNPTVRCKVYLEDGTIGVASVPSGASVGSYEALELRDKDGGRYSGKGTLKAVKNINEKIREQLLGIDAAEQGEIDGIMRRLDGTENKSGLGANATLAVSLAVCDASARSKKVPLHRHISALFGGHKEGDLTLPTPMLNILNGGAHAKNNLEIQEFMILPLGFTSFSEKLRAGAEIYHALKKILTDEGYSFSIGDEGGFAPDFESDEVALDMILKAINAAGYSEKSVKLALDVASSEWYEGGSYNLLKRGEKKSTAELTEYLTELLDKYPIVSIEDGLSEDDYFGHERLTELLGDRAMLVGDDLFATNKSRLEYGIKRRIANTILIKPNQIGTLTEVLEVIALAKSGGYDYIISHRSGETEDSFIADLAVGTGARFIKTGAPRGSERLAKYNRLLEIEAGL
ncbi:MAG: phosphopyruvate hydratase [Clostridia bacterium]|nr:phosphopyruvate hydratase [Clostridia bacterium]